MSDDLPHLTPPRIDDQPLSDAVLTAITEQTGMELLAEHLLFKNFNPRALDQLVRPSAPQPGIVLTTRELSIIVSGNGRIYLRVDASELPPTQSENHW